MLKRTQKYFGPIRRNVTFCVSCKNTMLPAQTKFNIVRGTVIYNEYIKCEINRKCHLDTRILFLTVL